jgi:hypothetical protein
MPENISAQLLLMETVGQRLFTPSAFLVGFHTTVSSVSVFPDLGPTTAKLDEPEVISAKQGDDVTLSCSAVGHPTPHLSWTREVR